MLKIAVAGASGYAGGEVLRLLLGHPGYGRDFQIGSLTGGANAGQLLGDITASLPELAHHILEETTPENIAGHDAAILALPHGLSAALHLPESMYVVDCGADYRLRNPEEWLRYYATPYAGSRTYGLPEIPGNREAIKNTRYIAVPGCFPTGATLAALPGVAAGAIAPEISVVSVTGVSGAGKKAAVKLLGAETMENLRAYNVGSHRHTPEITQNLQEVAPEGEDVRVVFTPVLAPLTRGILTTVTAPARSSRAELRGVYEDFCATEPFVTLLPDGQQPETQNVRGSNMVHLQTEVVDGMAVITSAIDNLTKGTAGAAIQCLNLMLGWDETSGLPKAGV